MKTFWTQVGMAQFLRVLGTGCTLLTLMTISGCGSSTKGGQQSPVVPQQFALSLVFLGPGTGHVTITPSGLDCHADCSATFAVGTTVMLHVASDNPSTFDGLGGDPGCSTGAVSIVAAVSCVVTFNPGPSNASISGTQLLLQTRHLDGSLSAPTPYFMRGVVWSPASTNTNTSPSDPSNTDKRRPEFAKWGNADIPLMASMNVNTVRLDLDPGFDGVLGPKGWRTLDALYASGIMVIMTVDDGVNNSARIQGAVSYYRNHPAILMFSLGSEWNINLYFNQASSITDAAQRTEKAAQLVKSLDANHPVATSYGDIDIDTNGLRLSDTQNYVSTIVPTVDVWSVNVFRGNNFGLLFQQWKSITSKPMYVGEFGVDAFHTTDPTANPPAGQVNEQEQSVWDESLWNDIFRNLSGRNSQGVAIGGTIFEWTDEWWKCSSISQSTCGFPSGGFPDGFSNETYFGKVDIARKPRQVYSVLQGAFSSQYSPGPQQVTFTASSAGLSGVHYQFPCFSLAEFDKGRTVLYRKGGLDCGGRGFNVAAINPSTGDLLTYPGSLKNFDTWATRDTGTEMTNMINFLNGLPNGTVVLMAVADEAGLNVFPTVGNACAFLPYPWVQRGLQTIEALGAKQIASYCYNDSWSMIAVKGEGVARGEQLGNPDSVATTQTRLTIP